MKNHSFLFFISVIILCSCQKRLVPEQFDGGDERGFFKIETFWKGGHDSIYRKVVVDSSWVDVK